MATRTGQSRDRPPTSVGIFPNDRSLIRPAASVAIEQNDEWLVGKRYLSNHSLEALLDQEKNDKDREETRELTTAGQRPIFERAEMPTSRRGTDLVERCSAWVARLSCPDG